MGRGFLGQARDAVRGLFQGQDDRLERFERRLFFRHAARTLDFNAIPGDYAEFGCHGAGTFVMAADALEGSAFPRHLWAFDSFQGLPPARTDADRHPAWVPGTMSMSEADFVAKLARRRVARSRFTTVPGFFHDTLVDGPGRPDRIALAYVDCDLHSSTQDVLRFLAPRLAPGAVLAFDDWNCWSMEGDSGERRAFEAFRAGHPEIEIRPFLSFGWHGASFAVWPPGSPR